MVHLPQVAYHGVPERAYEVFIKALQAKYWRDAPRLENENPAGTVCGCGWFINTIDAFITDVIMDVAGNHKLRAIITGYYERSSDPQLVRDAIKKACSNSKSKSREILDTVTNKVHYAIYGAKRYEYWRILYLYTSLPHSLPPSPSQGW